MTTATAQDWIDTDPNTCRDDVQRLGLDGAVEFQLFLIIERAAAGDNRWDDITEDDMREALSNPQPAEALST